MRCPPASLVTCVEERAARVPGDRAAPPFNWPSASPCSLCSTYPCVVSVPPTLELLFCTLLALYPCPPLGGFREPGGVGVAGAGGASVLRAAARACVARAGRGGCCRFKRRAEVSVDVFINPTKHSMFTDRINTVYCLLFVFLVSLC